MLFTKKDTYFSNSMLVFRSFHWPFLHGKAMKALLPVDECCSAREVGLLGGFVEFQVGLVRTLGGFCTISMKESCEGKYGIQFFV